MQEKQHGRNTDSGGEAGGGERDKPTGMGRLYSRLGLVGVLIIGASIWLTKKASLLYSGWQLKLKPIKRRPKNNGCSMWP